MGIVGRLDQYASMLAGEFDDYSMSENLITYSTNFGVVWSSSLTLTLNNATAPDGTLTAAKIQRPINSGNSNITNSPTLLTNTDYCYSAFIKLASTPDSTYSVCSLSSSNGSISPAYASISYNFATGAISSFGSLPTISGVIPYPNGWYRLYMVFNTSSQTNANLEIRPLSNNLVSDFYIWGAQLERGSVATDYTPTTTTAINRVLASTTNTNITGLGTYYSSGFNENVGFTTFLSANVFPPYDLVYDEFGGTLFGAGQGRYMRQNTDKSVIVYNEIDEVSLFLSLTVKLWGAGGGGGTAGGWNFGATGGGGGFISATLSLPLSLNGTNLILQVGQGGIVNGTSVSFGGGGQANRTGSDNRYGSNGGGYTGLFIGSVSQANALLIAGGGGGGGSSRAGTGNIGGAGGGTTGQDGVSAYDSKIAYRGLGGTQSAGGAQASSDADNTNFPAAALIGGTARVNGYGGAGGGGYWGGSAGGYSESNTMGGGGGGSGYINPTYGSGSNTQGNFQTSAGTSDPGYPGSVATGGAVATAGSNGFARITYNGIETTYSYTGSNITITL